MRINNQVIISNAIRNMDQARERLSELQERVSSGKKFTYASDDPQAASTSLSLRSTMQVSQAYLDTAQNAENWMDTTDASLTKMIEIATRSASLLIRGLNDAQGTSERKDAMGTEVDGNLHEAVDVANSKVEDKYIFSGYKITTQPYSLVQGTGGAADSAAFAGDTGVITRNISPSQPLVVNVDSNGPFSDLFAGLVQARDALIANDKTAMGAALTSIQNASSSLTELSTGNGARLREVGATIERISKTNVDIKNLLAKKEDVDMVEAISLYRNQETVYQTVLEVSNRAISSMNLFSMLA